MSHTLVRNLILLKNASKKDEIMLCHTIGTNFSSSKKLNKFYKNCATETCSCFALKCLIEIMKWIFFHLLQRQRNKLKPGSSRGWKDFWSVFFTNQSRMRPTKGEISVAPASPQATAYICQRSSLTPWPWFFHNSVSYQTFFASMPYTTAL